MPKQRKIWFVVADGSRARVFSCLSGEQDLDLVVEFDSPDSRSRTKELGSDKPPRSFESLGGARHAMEPKSDFHETSKADFARLVAETVNGGLRQNSFRLLALIAPPRVLHDIKANLSDQASDCIAAELAKDLTRMPMEDLRERLLSMRIHRVLL